MSITINHLLKKIAYNFPKQNVPYNTTFFRQCSCKTHNLNSEFVKSSVPLKTLCKPVPTVNEVLKISSVLSMNIGLSHISWARIEIQGDHLTHLDHVKFPDHFNRMELNDIYLLISKIVSSIPEASVYVLETVTKTFKGGSLQMAYYVSSFQVTAIILTLLNSTKPSITDSQVVFFLKPRLTGRLFDLLVGTEVVSSLSIVQHLLSGQNHKFVSRVASTSEILKKYQKSTNVEKEILGKSLLQGLTFINLIIHRKAECFKKLLGETEYN